MEQKQENQELVSINQSEQNVRNDETIEINDENESSCRRKAKEICETIKALIIIGIAITLIVLFCVYAKHPEEGATFHPNY